MLYKDIVKRLAKSRNHTIDTLAKAIGLRSQQALSQRLKDSWNPGMADAQKMLGELGYKVVFVPSSTNLAEGWYEPEFPERPASKNSEK